MADGGRPIWIAGYLIATYGPIILAVGFRRIARCISARWVVHVLFFPAAILALNVGERIMLSVIEEPDFDATLGAPIMPALLLVVFAVALYLVALVVDGLKGAEIIGQQVD
jgi:hypothetical protein